MTDRPIPARRATDLPVSRAFAVIDGGRPEGAPSGDRPAWADRRRAAWLAAELDAAGDFFTDPLGTRPLSPALSEALDAVAGLPPCDLVLVPREADAEMVEAGAAAAGVDPLTAARVWRGMLGEAE